MQRLCCCWPRSAGAGTLLVVLVDADAAAVVARTTTDPDMVVRGNIECRMIMLQ